MTSPYDAYNLPRLGDELNAGGVPVTALSLYIDADGVEIWRDVDADGVEHELPPEAAPIIAAHDPSTEQRTAAFETNEDTERLRLVNERARTDPAFAALADLTLGSDR